jgi:hypothetical protein
MKPRTEGRDARRFVFSRKKSERVARVASGRKAHAMSDSVGQ